MNKTSGIENSNDIINIDYQILGYRVMPTLSPDKYTVEAVPDPPNQMVTDLLNRPMCYFKKTGTVYDLYVSVLVKKQMTIDTPTIDLVGSTYFIDLDLIPDINIESGRVICLKFANIPRPIGFKVPSVSVTVWPKDDTGNEEGSKSITVDYEDADEEIIVPQEGAGSRRRRR